MPSHVASIMAAMPAGANRIIPVDFGAQLTAGVLLHSGTTPTVVATPVTDPVLTISEPAVTTAIRQIKNRTCAAKEAITFRASGGVAGTRYKIAISAAGADAVTDVANSEVYPAVVYLNVN